MKTVAALLFISSSLVACGGPQGAGDGRGDGGTGAADGGPVFTRVEGSVVGLDGAALAGVHVELCGAPCRAATTDAKGAFAFAEVPMGIHGVKATKPNDAAGDFGTVVVPIYLYDFNAERIRKVPPLLLPRVGRGTALAAGRQDVAVDAALTLGVDAAALQFPAGSGAPHLAGIRIPTPLFPDFCVPSVRVIAEWALAPFGTRSTAPIAIHIGDSLGLQPKQSVSLVFVDPDIGRPMQFGSGTVSADGKSIDADNGVGLKQLTWLLVGVVSGGP